MSRDTHDEPWVGPLPAAPGCDCHICRPDVSYGAEDRRAIDTILRYGWQVTLVSPDGACTSPDHGDHEHADLDGGRPAFAYTVGLGHRAAHPELLISGLDLVVMQHALNRVAHRVMKGRRLRPGDALEGVLAGVPVAIERASDVACAEAVTWSGWFHRGEPEALVVVWPDRRGVFAWQPGAPDILNEIQPPEWRVPIVHTGGLAIDPSWDFPVPPEQRAFSCAHVVDDGSAILSVAREFDAGRGEDWSIHCGASDHTTDEMRLVHLAHLVRSAPSLREISHLGLGEEASRTGPDAEWKTAQLS